jgi:hypothetical protein
MVFIALAALWNQCVPQGCAVCAAATWQAQFALLACAQKQFLQAAVGVEENQFWVEYCHGR